MCDEDKLYLRITNDYYKPAFVYGYLAQEFSLGHVLNLSNRLFLGRRNLLLHPIVYEDVRVELGDIATFVQHKTEANLSVGYTPQNFGDVELLNAEYITVKR